MSKPNKKSRKSNSQKTEYRSATSSKSFNSMASVGIGSKQSNGKVAGKTPHTNKLRFRLMPEGSGNNLMNIYDHYVFDCVVFVIFCEKHRTVALTNTSEKHRMYSWFPYVFLHEVFTWNKISRDGLAIILGQSDVEMDPTLATLPEHTVSWLHILRLQMPQTKKIFLRVTQFVKLHEVDNCSDDPIPCCQQTNRIRWVKLSDLLNNCLDNLWGDDVLKIVRSLSQEQRRFLHEYPLDSYMCFADSADEEQLYKNLELSIEMIQEMYEAYIHHLYPAFFMSYSSFQCMLLKLNVEIGSNLQVLSFLEMIKLYRAICRIQLPNIECDSTDCMTFKRYLLAICAMDPRTDCRNRARIRLLFK